MECLAIIPARGGSKGIPRKNVHLLAGRPLISYNVQQAKQARLVNRVIVSTDDAEIAAISEQYGAEIVWRPAEISGDNASSESALVHVLEYLQQREGYQPDLVAFLQCTSPLTLAEDIDNTIQALLDEGADSALAVIPFHYFLWRSAEDGNATGINHDKRIRPLRQEREPQYLETGAVYVMRVNGFLETQHRFFGKTAMYIMPAERRLEIDEVVDFQIAEFLIREQQASHQLSSLPETVTALILDFDGVFTDNKVLVFQDGREAVVCDRGDGFGIDQLKRLNIPILVLSSEANPVVKARADKLGILTLQGIQDKSAVLEQWLKEQDIDPSRAVYVGNDLNDLACMDRVGCSIAVADAHHAVLKKATIVLSHRGGDGAIREVSDLIIKRMK